MDSTAFEATDLILVAPPEIGREKLVDIRAEWLSQLSEGERSVFVDLSAAAMIDSSGLGLLVELSQILKRSNRKFALVSPCEHVRTLLAVTRLDMALPVVDALPN